MYFREIIHILMLVLIHKLYTTVQHFKFIFMPSWRGKIQTQVFLRKKQLNQCPLRSSTCMFALPTDAFVLAYVVAVQTPFLSEFDSRQIHIIYMSTYLYILCVFFKYIIYTYIRDFICTS